MNPNNHGSKSNQERLDQEEKNQKVQITKEISNHQKDYVQQLRRQRNGLEEAKYERNSVRRRETQRADSDLNRIQNERKKSVWFGSEDEDR
ncbi:hypothetical protein L3Y34_005857 [Caenorhabditis briggsae]|uniref:Uncharacterized protein n=1 Tax=Caenorhabditis briggsae TaxID=6238 RepID=A0AAE9A2H2_CAEBR|nr:hypothetical protein L3Y34_005857 [Caenorhabditis briggsae]